MSNEIKLEVTCVHCLGTGIKKIYPMINGNEDLVAKDILFEEELFLYRCPHCGHYQKISYECLYYDDKLKYAVALSRDGHKFLKKLKLELGGYQIRFVREISELKEKIVIKENNLDDRIIEIMKYNVRNSLTSKATYNLVLTSSEEGLQFVLLYPDREVIKTFAFSMYDYLVIEKKYLDYLDNDYIVDALFASKSVLRINKIDYVNIDYH